MFTLSDLQLFRPEGTSLGVVGYPIVHSLSPVFQNAALQALAKEDESFKDWDYLKIEAPVEDLSEVVSIALDKGFRGLNLTLPHKVEVLGLLDSIDPLAEKMGAVNTLSFEAGNVKGYNTDGYGFSTAVKHHFGIEIKNRPVVIFGAGGASRAACVKCLSEGCSELWIGNRSKDRLGELLAFVQKAFPEATVKGFQLGVDFPVFAEGAIMVNATSLGLKPEDPIPLHESYLASAAYVYDMVYGKVDTKLVQLAKEKGIPAADGKSMLIFQGAKSLNIWTGKAAPVDIMMQALDAAVNVPN